MSMDLTFLSDSYTKQILHQLNRVQMQKTGQTPRRNDFGSILSAKDRIPKNVSADQIRLDLTGKRGVLNDRGTDWLSAFMDLGGYML